MASTVARLARSHALASHLAAPARTLLVLPAHRHAMMSALAHPASQPAPSSSSSPSPPSSTQAKPALGQTPPVVVPADAASPQYAARPPRAPKAERPKPTIKAAKAAISLTPAAVQRLRALLGGPTPQLIRIGVRNKGCAGLSYHLEYVDAPGRFDEVVEQDGVRVLIDSKALFSIIGSEMDWHEDALSAKFAFKNPNIKDACGCGESFTVGSSTPA